MIELTEIEKAWIIEHLKDSIYDATGYDDPYLGLKPHLEDQQNLKDFKSHPIIQILKKLNYKNYNQMIKTAIQNRDLK